MRRRRKAIVCRELAELVTDYLEDALAPEVRRAVESHLEDCPDCARVVAQWRRVVELTGRIGRDDVAGLDDRTRTELFAAFRSRPPTAGT